MKREFWRIFGIFFSTSLFLAFLCEDAAAQNQQTCGQKKADKLLQQGETAFGKKEYPLALSLFEQAAQAAPKCPVPFFQKGLVFLDTNKNDEAVIAFQEASKRNFNESFRLSYGICAARFAQQKLDEALKNCEESARLNNNYYWTFLNLAYLYHNLGIPDKSMTATERALTLDPKSAEMLVQKSRLLFIGQKYEEAVKAATEAAEIDPKNEEAFILLGVSYAALSKNDAALRAAERAYEINPKSFEAINFKAATLNDMRRFSEALPLATEAVNMQPNNDRALFVLGTCHANLKNYAKGVEYLSQSVKINPDFFEAWLSLSSAHLQNSLNWEKGEAAAAQAVRLRPDDGNANFQLGLTQLTNGKMELSVKSFDAAIKNKSPRSVSAAAFKGFALVALKRQPEAEKSFEQAFILKPGASNDYFSLAEIYFYRWDLEKAREQLRKSIEFAADDEDDAAYSYLSWSYILGGNPEEAIAAANEAVQQNPKYFSGYTNRCRAFNEAKLPDIAIKDCQKALSLRPNNGEVLYYLGRSYSLKKDAAQEKAYNQKAIATLEKRLNFSFGAPKPVAVSNVAQNMPSETDEGVVSINSPGYSYMLYLLASAYFINNDFEAASRAYEKVVETRPRFPNLRYNLAVSYLRLKRPDVASAEAQYQALLKLDPKLAANLRKTLSGYKKKK